MWYTDVSKTNKGTGAAVYGHGMRPRFSFSLGRYTTVFQLKYVLLRNVLMRILKGAVVKGKFIFLLAVKMRSKHLTIVEIAKGWSGTATNRQ
jgi:hypothetical protein